MTPDWSRQEKKGQRRRIEPTQRLQAGKGNIQLGEAQKKALLGGMSRGGLKGKSKMHITEKEVKGTRGNYGKSAKAYQKKIQEKG